MKRSTQISLWLVAVVVSAGAIFAGAGSWLSGTAKRTPLEIFQAYFEGAPENVKNLSDDGKVWSDKQAEISFTSEARIRLLDETRYHETACTENMLKAFSLKTDANQRCFEREKVSGRDESFLIHNPSTGQHYFFVTER